MKASQEPIAFSYLRFSTPTQAEGDSVRRQDALRDSWLKRNPKVRLDTSLVDDGVSGYSGRHRKNQKHALAKFLDLVERKRVPPGSYLIVENLDRLTREEPEVSIPLVMNLIGAGVRVVQLAPTEMVYEPGMDFGRLMMMLWELARGHGESKRKSQLLGSAWGQKKELARSEKRPYGRMCPPWLELENGKYRVKADAANAVRKIFRWSAEGLGSYAIVERLLKEGVRPIGRLGRWERSHVKKLLRSVSVIGTYQPMKGRGKERNPDGEPVPGFYPAVVSDALWHASHAAVKGRTRRSGRAAKSSGNPLSGLLISAIDHEKMHVAGSRGYKYVVSAAALQKRAPWRVFPLKPLVTSILSRLKEIAAADIFTDPSAPKIGELSGRLLDVEKRVAVAAARFEADPESEAWADQLSKCDREKRAIEAELAEARRTAANPISGTWQEAVSFMAKDEPERLRAALLETVEGIWVLVVGKRARKIAAVRVQFKGGAHRDYLILHQSGSGLGEGKTWCETAFTDSKRVLDLRDRKAALRLEAGLLKMEWPGRRPRARGANG